MTTLTGQADPADSRLTKDRLSALGGSRGLDVIAEGPHATTDRYTYVWKSDKLWAPSCRRLTIRFIDGMTRSADFGFR